VKYHHKWYNGKGYPDDRIEELPIEAAIIAVADAFDAMVNDSKMQLDKAIDNIRREAGTRFHPEVVKAFLRVLFNEQTGHMPSGA
jgi:HD-GYP domain-containing protein (c-di-GMP phosphodiesterase class II)